jgi:hypothetical protein
MDAKGNKARFAHEKREKFFKQKSELLERERGLDTEMLDTSSPIQDRFWEFHFLRKPVQYGIEPFDPIRIESHLRLSGEEISAWEYNLMLEMDLIFRATILK